MNDQPDAVELARQIRDGEVSAREVTESRIARIEELDPALNAVIETRFEPALDEIDRGLPAGPLTGVPMVVKALGADVAGLSTTSGSRLFAGDVADRDSELVRRYRAAGVVVLGLTNTPELGLNGSTEPALHGVAHNPWDHTRTPGGSSGGSAAAVAAGMVPVAHGNDGGGSIRLPAAMCGLFGLKPSRGRVSSAPYPSSLSRAISVQHALTTSVRDSALLLDIGSRPFSGDAFGAVGPRNTFLAATLEDPAPLRIGLVTELRNGPPTDPRRVEATLEAARLCESLGHHVVELSAPWDTAVAAATGGTLMGAATVATVEDRLAALGRDLAPDDLEPFTLVLLEHYRGLTAADLARALSQAQRLGWEVGAVFAGSDAASSSEQVDVLLTPIMCVETPELGYLDTMRPETLFERGVLVSGWTSIFNVTGMPAMSVPLGLDEAGLPTAAQFVGDIGREELLLALAAQLERARPWTRTTWATRTARTTPRTRA